MVHAYTFRMCTHSNIIYPFDWHSAQRAQTASKYPKMKVKVCVCTRPRAHKPCVSSKNRRIYLYVHTLSVRKASCTCTKMCAGQCPIKSKCLPKHFEPFFGLWRHALWMWIVACVKMCCYAAPCMLSGHIVVGCVCVVCVWNTEIANNAFNVNSCCTPMDARLDTDRCAIESMRNVLHLDTHTHTPHLVYY